MNAESQEALDLNPSDADAHPLGSDLGTAQESKSALGRLDVRARRILRRRLLKSANLKTLWGTVDVDTRLIIETLSGNVHPRNGDVISRMLERHSHMLERARQDEQRQQLIEELRRHGALPGPQVADAIGQLGLVPEPRTVQESGPTLDSKTGESA